MLKLARYLAGQAADRLEAKLLHVLRLLSWKRRRTLARRERDRPQEAGRWLTPTEHGVLAALASLIIPSDDTGPGAADADVTASLDRLLARSPARQPFYRNGLLACDEWAQREHGRSFVALTPDQQRALLRWLEPTDAALTRSASLTGKLRRKAVDVYRKWRCPLLELFPELSRDVMGAFYTHRVCWDWLGYDGPPMPDGYPDLRQRETSQRARTVSHAS